MGNYSDSLLLQTIWGGVRKNIDHFPGGQASLCFVPEGYIKQVGVVGHERFTQVTVQAEKAGKFLREIIVVADVELGCIG